MIRMYYMNYKEIVEIKITGEGDELERRKELWKKISSAYEENGTDSVKSVLIKYVDEITKNFEELLEQLRKKL